MAVRPEEDRYTLGRLCPRGHDYDGTGRFSLRYNSNSRTCVECNKERSRTEEVREYNRQHYRKNREKRMAQAAEYQKTLAGKESARRNKVKRRGYAAEGCSVKYRLALHEAFGGRCPVCGSGDDLTVDHIVPLVKGGKDSELNMWLLCRSCNSEKKDRSIADWLGLRIPKGGEG